MPHGNTHLKISTYVYLFFLLKLQYNNSGDIKHLSIEHSSKAERNVIQIEIQKSDTYSFSTDIVSILGNYND